MDLTTEQVLRQRAASAAKPVDPVAKARRIEQREKLIRHGLDQLDLWLADLLRRGLAGLEQEGPGFWEDQAARMVDAQAPGLAARLRRMGEIPASGPDWPARLLAALGRLALLVHAYRRQGELDADLRHDVRQMVGWAVRKDDVTAHGDRVDDQWSVLGQVEDDDGQLQSQRSWLRGHRSGRDALILQFAPSGSRFAETLRPGTTFEAELAFWPGACAQRARIERRGDVAGVADGVPHGASIGAFLDSTAEILARQPWMERFPCALSGVVPVYDAGDEDGVWRLVEPGRHALEVRTRRPWTLLALSGGRPLDVFGEWNGHRLWLLGAVADGTFHPLTETVS